MTGKDLFAAMNHVDDELVTEAETYTRRVIPMHTVRWLAALAACFCLLVCWAVAVQWNPMDAFYKLGEPAENAAMEETVEEKSTATVTTDTTEQETAVEEEGATDGGIMGGSGGSSASGALPTESPTEDKAEYIILAEALPAAQVEEKVRYADPLNGTFILDEDVQGTLDMLALVEPSKPARFLVTFDLYSDEKKLDENSDAYLAEVERLTELGYEFRTLNVQHRDKSVKVKVCGLFTTKQLAQFDASDDYGYVICFPENEDGTPLDWEDQAFLCGLPEADAQTGSGAE